MLALLAGPDDTRESALAAALAVNRAQPDVVWLQHEFGLYGRWQMPYHHALESFLAALRHPVVTTLHTVLSEPPQSVRRALVGIATLSSRLVVMSSQAAAVLSDVYDVEADRVAVIPHGSGRGRQRRRRRSSPAGRPMLLSFGLLSPGKGIDNVIHSLPAVLARWPEATYVIAGQSHPSLSWSDSIGHRHHLLAVARELGVDRHVLFIDRFLSEAELDMLLARADLVVLPNLDPQQASSGTLARAVGAGCAVVAGANAHSRDVAAHGAVQLVSQPAPDSIGAALAALLGDPGKMRRLRARSRAYAAATSWEVVGGRAARLVQQAGSSA